MIGIAPAGRTAERSLLGASLAALAALAIGLMVATPAQAAGSMSGAEKLRRLDIMLMVTGLRCRTTADNFTADYGEFTTNQSTDFMAILTKVKMQNPDVVIYTGMDAQGGPMLKQMRALGIGAKFMTGDGGCTLDFIKLAGDAMSDKAYCSQAGLPLDQLADKTFRDRYKKRFGIEVQVYAPYAYDAASAIVEAMKAAGSVEPAKYLPALKKVAFKGAGGDVAFDDKGDVKGGAVTVYQFKGGQWESLK